MSDKSRRKLLKSIAAGSGAVIAGKSLPESWSRPVVDSVLLPAHAVTSCAITGLYCNLNNDLFIEVLADGTVAVNIGGFTGQDTVSPIAGGFFDILTDRAAAPLRVTGTVVCNSTAISGDIIDGGGTPSGYTADRGSCPPVMIP